MNLFLIRHANAVNYLSSTNDINRILSKEGILQAKKLNEYLLNVNLKITEIYISNSLRTIQTAKLVIPKSKDQKRIILPDLYLASFHDLLNFINQLNTKNDILIIGHNDGISKLASYLINQSVYLDTASCIVINFQCKNSNEISGATGTLIDSFTPVND